ncbi:GntR family transcriptional regulator [Streptomyces sp. NPDC087866]|uniref:GntR family transcriptional regulator n=1 Tax=unclassified Streptomyces TaxID=2593676 RepID=UPI0022557E8C|nr:GntR family transcriptional regulator [Streptomyces sp. NBC_01789]MCX4449047.1 GntR family transcriptional regulator [Streptomyces sp. NBC_01789]
MVNVGKYLELAEALSEKITSGELAPGDQLPTVAELAKQFGVAPNTASRAVQVLKERGLLSGRIGGKTWVRVPPPQTVRRNTRYQAEKDLVLKSEAERRGTGVSEMDTGMALASAHRDTLTVDVVKCPPDIAEVLGIEPGASVLRRVGVRHPRKGAGAVTGVSYIPYEIAKQNPDLFDAGNEPWPGGSQHQLHMLGIEVGRIEDRVTASQATEEEAVLQDIPPSVPVIRVRKITYSTTGRAVEVNDLPFPADRTTLIFETPLTEWDT